MNEFSQPSYEVTDSPAQAVAYLLVSREQALVAKAFSSVVVEGEVRYYLPLVMVKHP